MCLEKVILPFPAIDEKLSSAILIFSFLGQGEQVLNKEERLVMWS